MYEGDLKKASSLQLDLMKPMYYYYTDIACPEIVFFIKSVFLTLLVLKKQGELFF